MQPGLCHAAQCDAITQDRLLTEYSELSTAYSIVPAPETLVKIRVHPYQSVARRLTDLPFAPSLCRTAAAQSPKSSMAPLANPPKGLTFGVGSADTDAVPRFTLSRRFLPTRKSRAIRLRRSVRCDVG